MNLNRYEIIAIWLSGGAMECLFTHWRGSPTPAWTLLADAVILAVLFYLGRLERAVPNP